MADSEYELKPPPPPAPGQPLPRIRNYPMPDEEEKPPSQAAGAPETPRGRKKGRDRKKDRDLEEGERTTILEEQTPSLDTYETRRAIRIGAGVALLGLVVLLGFFVAGQFGPDEPEVLEEEAPSAGPVAQGPSAERLEREARVVLGDARRFAEQGDADLTLRRLKSVVDGYPKTAAAAAAAEAIRRGEQGLPLFVDVPLVIARNVPPPVVPERQPDVIAVEPAPPAAPGPAEVVVAPPPVPPEPRKETGLTFERADIPARPLPGGFRPRPEAGVHPTGWPLEITCDKDGAAMVLVPGGDFLMGRDDGPGAERPAHRVALSAYYIDQHEVTARQFEIFARATGRRPTPRSEGDGEADPDAMPATRVSANDAYQYAEWAGKALPTEAQWEMAARTTDGRLFPWGNDPPGREREPGRLAPVMSDPLDLSPYGVFDLAGNVREWTQDWFDPRFYQQHRGAVVTEPANPTRGRSRTPEVTIRGGSPNGTATWRAGMRPDSRLNDLGFRCVLPVERPAAAPGVPAPGNSGGLVPF
jgi:formylglycine-generating enzyme required for sulfatase activity